MKRVVGIAIVILGVIGLVFLGAKSFGNEKESQQIQIGRFQLFQGTYTALDAKSNRADKETAVFLLDTSTGKVKRYSTGLLKDGTFFEEWVDTEKSY